MPSGKARCSERIHSGSFFRPHQCARSAVGEENGRPYCAQHMPSTVKKRRGEAAARRMAEYQREKEGRELERARADFRAACEAACREIAAGHNDPRGLVVSVLDTDPDRVTVPSSEE